MSKSILDDLSEVEATIKKELGRRGCRSVKITVDVVAEGKSKNKAGKAAIVATFDRPVSAKPLNIMGATMQTGLPFTRFLLANGWHGFQHNMCGQLSRGGKTLTVPGMIAKRYYE